MLCGGVHPFLPPHRNSKPHDDIAYVPFIKRDVFAQKLIGLKFQNEIAYMCGWRYWNTETGRKREIQTAREAEYEIRPMSCTRHTRTYSYMTILIKSKCSFDSFVLRSRLCRSTNLVLRCTVFVVYTQFN